MDDGSGAAVGGLILLVFVVIGFAMFAFWVWSIIDAARLPDAAWSAAGQSKILWIVLIVVFGLLASLVYLLWPRPAVLAASRSGLGAPGLPGVPYGDPPRGF